MDIGHDLPVRETHVRSGNDPHSRPSKDISVKFRDPGSGTHPQTSDDLPLPPHFVWRPVVDKLYAYHMIFKGHGSSAIRAGSHARFSIL